MRAHMRSDAKQRDATMAQFLRDLIISQLIRARVICRINYN